MISQNNLIYRVCPTCDSTETIKIYNSELNPLQLDLNDLANLFVGYRKKQCFFNYSVCKRCQTLYCSEYFDTKTINFLYSKMPDNKFGLDHKAALKTQAGYAKQIVNNLDKKDKYRILEIGPDLGLFILSLKELIEIESVVFIEPNLDIHEKLKNNFKYENFKIEIYSNLQELKDLNKFDLIVGIHVLDHMLNPIEEITFYKNLLNEGGLFSFVTHNYNSVLRKILRKKWPPFCLQHPQLYSASSLSHFASTLNIEHVKTQSTTNWLDLNGLSKRLFSILGLKLRIKYFKFLIFPIKFGNIISIFRKNGHKRQH